MKFLLALALVLAPCFGWAQGSFASSVSPASLASSSTCPPANQLRLLSAEQTTLLLDACDEVALFHAHRGAQLLAQGKVEEAAVALEKALLLDPNLPGAQLDYAQALALIGLKGSARAMLAEVLQRSDIQPALKAQLEKGAVQNSPLAPSSLFPNSIGNLASALQSWQWSALAQTALGHETNLNSATYTDSLTLMLSNGPVNIGMSDSAKPVSGMALKSLVALQGSTRAGEGLLAHGELLVNASLASKNASSNNAGIYGSGTNNQTAEAAIKYMLPMIAGPASGQWQLALGGTQLWLASASAYQDSGAQLKFNWDTLGKPCKLAPSVGAMRQSFPLSETLDGTYHFARLEVLCKQPEQESHLALGGGNDTAHSSSRPGGNKRRLDVLLRHEHMTQNIFSTLLGGYTSQAQLSAWLRLAKSIDAQPYSELLGDLKSITKRADVGLGYWVPVNKRLSAGLNLEATSQRSTNTLFNLRNSGVYAGIRWSEN